MENATEELNRIYDTFKDRFQQGLHDTLWQILINGSRKRDLTSCFVSTYPDKRGYEVGIADRDKPGFTPTNMIFVKPVTPDMRHDIIEELNRQVFGLEPWQCDVIIASTMSRSHK